MTIAHVTRSLSNKFSIRTDKYVLLNTTLAYRKAETE
jgi:hypothetical protein